MTRSSAVRSAATAVAAVMLLGGCLTTGEVSDERFVRFFDELAFGSALDRKPRERLSRWEGPLDFDVQGDESFVESTRRVASDVARLAGIRDEPRRRPGAALAVRQDPAGTLFPVDRDLVDCYVRYTQRDGAIVGAEVHVAASEPVRVEHCLYHELLHVLGLGHSGVIASLMSPFHRTEGPSRWDAMAARFIMSGSVDTGMPRALVLQALETDLPELRNWPDLVRPLRRTGAGTAGRPTS
ncbi:MAG: hypothetical protein RLO51_25620 [Thalassobaculum sp.]|uniref:hypothetical protein n=1 Tax=Thalassobaculum sp. TaxID=2022740 RepID=UPI0032EFEF1C